MLALRTSSRLSPLLNTALNRYSIRPSDYPWDLYIGGFSRSHLLIGESLGVQAFDVYRNFCLYHSIAPYTIPALRYRYDYPNYSQSSILSIDDCLFGALGLFWSFGTWVYRCAKRVIGFCLPIRPRTRFLTTESTTDKSEKIKDD